jgi:hypothetical protein
MVADTLSCGATVAAFAACVAANDVEAIVNKLAKMARVVRFMFFSPHVRSRLPLRRLCRVGQEKLNFL